MKVLLDFLFDVFFGDDSSDASTANCEEYEFDSAVYVVDDKGEVDLKPSGSGGTPIE